MDSSRPEVPQHEGARTPLEEGIALSRQGERERAAKIFRELVHRNPYDEDAWLWLSWVADSPAETMSLLREAKRLLPDSGRIDQGVAWARDRLPPGAAEPQRERPATRLSRRSRQVMRQVDAGARTARQGAADTLEDLRDRVGSVGASRLVPGLPGWAATAVSAISLIALVLLVSYVAVHLFQPAPVVRAMALPAPAPEPAQTPSLSQRTDSYWTKVDVAWMQEDWAAAVSALEQIRLADPGNAEARKRLAEALYFRGQSLIDQNNLPAAMLAMNEAVRLDASSESLQKVHRDLQLYSEALDAYWVKDWPRAVTLLKRVFESTPAFRDTRAMLGQAYCYLGTEMMGRDELESAKKALMSSVALLPDWQEAQARLIEVQNLITPPRRIEVDLSDKLAVVYDGGRVIETFRICSGRPSSPTVAGRYKIKTKIEMAYASRWDLQMPYWLGIYDAGGSENGFHALPILSNGAILWRGALGTACSFGCIVLDTAEAKWLYDWADVGTIVFVNN